MTESHFHVAEIAAHSPSLALRLDRIGHNGHNVPVVHVGAFERDPVVPDPTEVRTPKVLHVGQAARLGAQSPVQA